MSKKEKDEEKKGMVQVGGQNVSADLVKQFEDDAKENLENVDDAFYRVSTQNSRFSVSGNLINKDGIKFSGVILRETSVNVFFEEKFDPSNPTPPDCTSLGGIRPDSSVEKPVAETCAECPNNKYGTGIDRDTGEKTKGKACSNTRRLVVKVDGVDVPALVSIAPSALKGYNQFLKNLSASEHPIPYYATRVEFTFDTAATFPKILVAPLDLVTSEEYAQIKELRVSAEIENVLYAYADGRETEEIPTADAESGDY